MKKVLITAALFLITTGAFAQTASTISPQSPNLVRSNTPPTITANAANHKLEHLKKDVKRDVRDVRADIKNLKLDITNLKNEIRQRRIDIKNGDKGAAIALTKEIRKDRMDIRRDKRDIRGDKKDIRRDIRHARKIEHHLHHLSHVAAVHKAGPVK